MHSKQKVTLHKLKVKTILNSSVQTQEGKKFELRKIIY